MAGEQFVRDLCNLEVPSTIRISPDCKQIVYSTQLTWGHRKGKLPVSTLWTASTGQRGSSQKLTSGSSNDFAPAWHPQGKIIAFISDRAKPGQQWAIYTLEVDGDHEPRAITPVENESHIASFSFSPDGKYIAFLSADEKSAKQREREESGNDVKIWGQWEYQRLRIVNLETSHISSLSLERHVTSLSWSPDGENIAFVSYETSDDQECLVAGSQVSIIGRGLDSPKDMCHFPNMVCDLTWAKDGKIYFWSGFPEDKLFCGAGVFAIDSNSPLSKYEHVAFGTDDDACHIRLVNGEILVYVQKRLESHIATLAGNVLYSRKEDLEAFDAASAPDGHGIILAIVTSNINQPYEVFTTTANNEATMTQLSSHGEILNKRNFGDCSFLTCSSTDGEVEIDSLYLSPPRCLKPGNDQKPQNPLPTLVLIHGGPNTRIANAFNTYYFMFTPYLLSLGYGILITNYRGSSGRGDRFARASLGGIGIHDYADVIAATQNAIEQGYADKDRLIVGGWSQGGFLTLLCSVRNGLHGLGWKFQASVAGASICDIDSMALTSDSPLAFEPALHEGRVVWNMDRDDSRNRSASALWAFKEAMAKSKELGTMVIPPMLILHGEDDARCHVSNAWAVQRALKYYDLPFESAIYPRQGHMFLEQNFWVDMNLRIARWCHKYIGDGVELPGANN